MRLVPLKIETSLKEKTISAMKFERWMKDWASSKASSWSQGSLTPKGDEDVTMMGGGYYHSWLNKSHVRRAMDQEIPPQPREREDPSQTLQNFTCYKIGYHCKLLSMWNYVGISRVFSTSLEWDGKL